MLNLNKKPHVLIIHDHHTIRSHIISYMEEKYEYDTICYLYDVNLKNDIENLIINKKPKMIISHCFQYLAIKKIINEIGYTGYLVITDNSDTIVDEGHIILNLPFTKVELKQITSVIDY